MKITNTAIDGLLIVDLDLHGDNRGWFKENWQREKMVAAGLPDFLPVQNNISFNETTGTTRGLHAEPWDKYVSVATGRIFGAWVDLREGPGFGTVVTVEVGPDRAVFVPRGVANGYQTLAPETAYTYLVNDHWSPEAEYAFVNLADPTLAIDWPIPLQQVEISAKDLAHPPLGEVEPIAPRKTLVIGAGGQLGRALAAQFEGDTSVEYVDRDTFDLTGEIEDQRPWREYSTVINAAAYTAVDAAETERESAWAINATAVAQLARVTAQHGVTLVHISSDYVFDGSATAPYSERAPLSPLGVYGQSKAAGDLAATTNPRHYILRTSWVIGDGANFVRTMASLAERGISPRVVDDQVGRLTFTSDLARAIAFLLNSGAPAGTYNVTGSGEPASWAQVAARVFELAGRSAGDVTPVSTDEYYRDQSGPISPRPAYSVLDLSKIESLGFAPTDQWEGLGSYLNSYLAGSAD
ncbi:dTDP-4-dehydrorhamnose reductase [Actinomyces sp. F1_1611]